MRPRYVTYKRVSTKRQGASGLGLEAQQETLRQFCREGTIVGEFCDVLSGKDNNRPQLLKAIQLAKDEKAVLVVAKLDRLSRNLTFIATLLDSGVAFQCCDMPEANEFTLHIFASFAQHERKAISTRVKEGLGSKRKRIAEGDFTKAKPDPNGQPVLMKPDRKGRYRLGNPNGYTDSMRKLALEARRKKTAENEEVQTAKMRIQEMLEYHPNITLKELAAKLNMYKMKTIRKKPFTPYNVQYLKKIVEREMQQE